MWFIVVAGNRATLGKKEENSDHTSENSTDTRLGVERVRKKEKKLAGKRKS
jgi:hypothetical protein